MSGIFGLLGLADGDLSYVNVVGQKLVFDAANEYLRVVNEDINNAYTVFLQAPTENHKERYKLPGGGRLQKRGGAAPSAAVKAYGGWDVAYPLEDFGAALTETDVAMAYTTIAMMQRHLDTIRIQSINTRRYEILRRIFKNTTDTFVDPRDDVGSLTIQPLANNDSVVYPPVLGAEAEAAEMHYLESNYTVANISETNNPLITLRNELEEHFGAPTGYGSIAVFVPAASVSKLEALTDYDQVKDNYIINGTNADLPTNLPKVPGRVIGRCNGVWVVEWRWIPDNYAVAIDLETEAPLKMRFDLASSGLPQGLTLVSQNDKYPLVEAQYRDRFGVGAANRLNGVVLEFGTGGTYTIPSSPSYA
jgi:hypothetical protein